MTWKSRIGMIGLLALCSAGSPAIADNCRDNLMTERLGMIVMPHAERAETLSSREALRILSQSGGLNFRREVEDFWRIKVPRSVDPSELEIHYRIEGGDDRNGRARHKDEESQNFPVRLIPNQPRILCEDRTYRIISGGFTALARASGIGLSGLYTLEIDVDVRAR